MVRSKPFWIGGGLVLPLLIFAWSKTGISVSQLLTDNVYLLNMKSSGLMFALGPFIELDDFVALRADAFFFNVNFNSDNTVFLSGCQVQKVFQLPMIGNNDALYINASVFLPSYYTDYSFTEFKLGDSLGIYFASKYRWVTDAAIEYRNFMADSIDSYFQPEFSTSVTLPIPYAFLSPKIHAGIKKYENRDIPFYDLSLNFALPLTYSYSCSFIFDFYRAGSPNEGSPLTGSYADDPFFEQENIHQSTDLTFYFNRLFIRQYAELGIEFEVYNRDFFEVESLERNDRGARLRAEFTKSLNSHFAMVLGIESIFNSSSAADFSYTKTGLELNIEWIF
ncbi:MAG: hypothetical protein WBB37_06805 [bacterium]